MRSNRHLSRGPPPAKGQPFRAHTLAWSSDGRWLAVGGHQRVLLISAPNGWTNALTVVSQPGGGGQNRVTFWPDGQLVAIGGSENNSYLWNPRTKKSRRVTGIVACAPYFADAWSCESPKGHFRVRSRTWGKAAFEVHRLTPQGYQKVWSVQERSSGRTPVMVLRNAGNSLLVAGGSTYSRTETQRMVVHRTSGTGRNRAHGSFFQNVPKLVSGGFVRQYHRGRYSCERAGVGKRIVSLGAKRYGSTYLTGHADGAVSLFDGCTLKWTHRHSRSQSKSQRKDRRTRQVVGVAHHPVEALGASVDARGRLCWWDLAQGKRAACHQLRYP